MFVCSYIPLNKATRNLNIFNTNLNIYHTGIALTQTSLIFSYTLNTAHRTKSDDA